MSEQKKEEVEKLEKKRGQTEVLEEILNQTKVDHCAEYCLWLAKIEAHMERVAKAVEGYQADMGKVVVSLDKLTNYMMVKEDLDPIVAGIDGLGKHIVSLDATVKNLLGFISAKMPEHPKSQPQTQPPKSPQQTSFEGFTEKELDDLPWTMYEKGKSAGKGAWIFSHQKDGSESGNATVRRLVSKLKVEGALNIHEHTYKLSGDNGQFVARFPFMAFGGKR